MSEPVLMAEERRTPRYSALERWGIPATYALSLLYTYVLTTEGRVTLWLLTAFTLAFVALTEVVCRQERRSPETWVWLGCMTCCLAGELLDRNRVWEEFTYLALHGFALYYYMVRSNRLYEGETGRFLPLDAVNAAFVFPFRYFVQRVLVTVDWVSSRPRKEKTGSSARGWIICFAVLAAAGMFVGAWKMLAVADDGFYRVLGDLSFDVDLDDFWSFVAHLILCIPVGAYLYGLILGSRRQVPEVLHARAGKVVRGLYHLKKVPIRVWTVLTCAFITLYAVFFVIQSSYLFGAFVHRLPEEFTVAEYARKGFFELCGVIALNFSLMGLIALTGDARVPEDTPTRATFAVLLTESLLFSVVAFSKLAMYIGCYGFTPLRLASTWLVVCVFTACIAAGYTLLTGKKSARWWILFNAVTFALLCFM